MTTIRRSISRLSRPAPYRGALIDNGLKRFEIKLLVLLWSGITLLSGVVGQQVYKLYAEDEQHFELSKSSQKLSMAVSPAKPMNTMPTTQTNMVQSIFHVIKAETPAVPVVDSKQQETQHSNANTQQVDTRSSLWQLSVQHPAVNELSLADQLASAKSQLQAGHFERARQTFERILMQDPHQVEALAGMLMVISQRGDANQRDDYLRRLREEIPEYAPDNNLLSLQLAD